MTSRLGHFTTGRFFALNLNVILCIKSHYYCSCDAEMFAFFLWPKKWNNSHVNLYMFCFCIILCLIFYLESLMYCFLLILLISKLVRTIPHFIR